jgi:hypothetical protein
MSKGHRGPAVPGAVNHGAGSPQISKQLRAMVGLDSTIDKASVEA